MSPIIPDGDVGEGGAYVITQRWVHDLGKFHAQSLEDQQVTFGRTKPDSVELDDKPPTAHISRVVIEEDGEELEIYRRSTPYGRVGELGLYFIAFSADVTRFHKMLARMFGTSGDGLHDHLTDFTRPGQRFVLLRAEPRRPQRDPAQRLIAVVCSSRPL